ncbi:MAG: hypothetical protein ABJF11_15810 [Reichenbachiella sp.]|uniref:hypothetical protein n=1 Tax=Reichenbachiella sp. TaxID=2184521 RepID=UPI0032631760
MEVSKIRNFKLFICAIVILLVCGCSERKTQAESTQEKDNIFQLISDPTNLNQIDRYLDWNYISKIVKPSSDKEMAAFEKIKDGFSYGKLGLSSLPEDVLYGKTRSYSKGDFVHVVYEIFTGNEIQFIDFQLDSVNNKIVDLFAYEIGESFINLVRNHVKTEDDNFDKLFILSSEALKNGDIEKAWDYFLMIPDDLHNDYPYRPLKMSIAEYDPVLYDELVSQWQDDAFDFRYLDYLNYKKALLNDEAESLLFYTDKLKETIGKSATLLAFEGYGLWLKGNSSEAFDKYEDVIKIAPNHMLGYSSKLDLLLLEGSEKEAIQLIKSINNKFHLSNEDWNEILIDHSDFLIENSEIFGN